MKMTWLFMVLLTTSMLTSCIEKDSFPPEPAITFKDFKIYPADSANLYLSFTDGDGNFGLNQEDTTGSFCWNGCLYYYNLFCEYYELQNGTWVHIPLDPFEDIPFYYRVPYLEPTGQNKAQQGEIKISMLAYYLLSDFDTCRFEIKVVDRTFKQSNTITTSTFIKP
jgi:hypothetical protein